METEQLKRIADSISEILELVKKDLERQKNI
jgi:hypothetical protein